MVVSTFPTATIPVLTTQQANYPAKNAAMTNTDYGDWAPRFGFAWRPFGRQNTVLRGGYGIYFWNTTTGGAAAGGAVFTGSQSLTQQLGSNGILTPTLSFPDPFTNFTSSLGTLTSTSLTFNAGNPNLKLPYVQDWNLTLEHSFLKQTSVRISYMGDVERRSQFTVDTNEAPPSNALFDQSLRPNPLVREINYLQNGGSDNTNELQVIVDRRMSHGVSFNAGWTWAHRISDINSVGPGEAFNLSRLKGNPSFTVPRQQLILTQIYEIPFGRGRAYLSHLPAVADGFLGGWKAVAFSKFETGQYVTPTYYYFVNFQA
jgi:hypothetical protein